MLSISFVIPAHDTLWFWFAIDALANMSATSAYVLHIKLHGTDSNVRSVSIRPWSSLEGIRAQIELAIGAPAGFPLSAIDKVAINGDNQDQEDQEERNQPTHAVTDAA